MLPEGPPPQQRPTRQETKADATDRAAREIIRDEGAARDAKTAALRAARLEQEGAAPEGSDKSRDAATSKTASGKSSGPPKKSAKRSKAAKSDDAR